VKIVNETLTELGLTKAHNKTFIGRVERGFDFLGYHFAPGRLTLAQATVERFAERAHRLYEQDRREPCGSPRLDAYVRRWCGWTTAGMPGLAMGPEANASATTG
jgi:RNA-directed DNA polymerase